MKLCISSRSNKKYTYMIDCEYNHMVFQNHAKISPRNICVTYSNNLRKQFPFKLRPRHRQPVWKALEFNSFKKLNSIL